jgi:hypothetical protein
MKWISVKDRLPEIGQEVLCFYTIGEFQYYEVGRIAEISTLQVSKREAHRSIKWKDNEHNIITPTHWLPLEPPLIKCAES